MAPARRRWDSPRRKNSKIRRIDYGVIAERSPLIVLGLPRGTRNDQHYGRLGSSDYPNRRGLTAPV